LDLASYELSSARRAIERDERTIARWVAEDWP